MTDEQADQLINALASLELLDEGARVFMDDVVRVLTRLAEANERTAEALESIAARLPDDLA
jgi:hypothetical protein